jgi:5-formyltetrahydrofolate cyclo-ligase
MAKKESGLSFSRDQAKRWLRGACSRARQAVPLRDRKRWSAQATERFLSLPEYRRAETVAVFLTFGSEIETLLLIGQAWHDGKRVLIPMCDRGFSKPYFAPLRPEDRLVKTPQGPLELATKGQPFRGSAIDLILVPGLAFDRQLNRLGYGGGVYDRLLAQSRRASHIGFFWNLQQLDHVPVSAHDVALDGIVTETRVLRPPRH